tara:strand:+ start:997 stop:1341 length:345 start_codon:yes stop_codon:yes gene_type:complete
MDILTLDIKILSRNTFDKYHWSKKRDIKDGYRLLVRNQMSLKSYAEIKKPEKFNIDIIVYRKRLLDFDNCVGGCKQLIDALVDENFIWDDSPKFVNMSIEQLKTNRDNVIIQRY